MAKISHDVNRAPDRNIRANQTRPGMSPATVVGISNRSPMRAVYSCDYQDAAACSSLKLASQVRQPKQNSCYAPSMWLTPARSTARIFGRHGWHGWRPA